MVCWSGTSSKKIAPKRHTDDPCAFSVFGGLLHSEPNHAIMPLDKLEFDGGGCFYG